MTECLSTSPVRAGAPCSTGTSCRGVPGGARGCHGRHWTRTARAPSEEQARGHRAWGETESAFTVFRIRFTLIFCPCTISLLSPSVVNFLFLRYLEKKLSQWKGGLRQEVSAAARVRVSPGVPCLGRSHSACRSLFLHLPETNNKLL